MPKSGLREPASLVRLVFHMRWVIPLTVALLTACYVIFEQVILQGHVLLSPHVVRTIVFDVLAGPALAFALLTWTLMLAQAEARAQRELAARNAIGEVTGKSLELATILQTALEKTMEFIPLPAGQIRLLEGGQLVRKAQVGWAQVNRCPSEVRVGHCVCGRCTETGQAIVVNDLAADPSTEGLGCAKEGFRSIAAVPLNTETGNLGVLLLASPQPNAMAPNDLQMLTGICSRIAMAVANAQLYKQAHRRARDLEIASILGQRMTAVLDRDKLLSDSVRLIRQKFGYYHASVLLVDAESGELVLKDSSGAGAEALKRQGLRLKIGQQGITGAVAQIGQALLCNDVSREPRYFAAEPAPQTKAELAVPLRAGQRVIGVLDVQSDHLDAFDKEDVTVLQILGSQIGSVVENARLFQETKQRYEAMVALHETSLDVIAQLDRPRLLEGLLRRGAQLLGVQGGALFLYDPDRKLAYGVTGYNTWRDLSGITFRSGEGVAGTVMLTGKPIIVNDYANWEHRSVAFEGTRLTRVIGLPLKWQDQLMGIINFIAYEESRPFDENDVSLATQFADLAAIAVKNAELHTQISQFNQELEQKVVERTVELTQARDEIAVKADQLRSLWAKTIRIQEQERARIALDMHDGVIQLITAARCELKATRMLAQTCLPSAAEERLDATREVLDEIESELRRAIHDLHPPVLDAVGLAPAMDKYIKRFQELSGIACSLRIIGVPRRLPSATEIAVFRVVEESLQNVATHAEAEKVTLLVEFKPDTLCVTVEDDGLGLELARRKEGDTGQGLGLLGMKERVRSLEGNLEICSEPGQGTRLVFCLPVEETED
ncbi:MAG: GAF domain-containing sensor histidine kinase [Chloroflexi bacterium]|nr:GAF domain-containing sensor histidine kinase [Chloroflexota bacterium]